MSDFQVTWEVKLVDPWGHGGVMHSLCIWQILTLPHGHME